MQTSNQIGAVLLLLVLLVFPLAVSTQSRLSFTRTALLRMDVVSRAALFETAIADAAEKEGVNPLVLWTIAYNETRFRPWLTSPKNAQGMMQFMPATASRYGLANPYEAAPSIRAAARYVRYLEGLFDGRLDSVLAAYNSGEGTVLAYLHGRKLRTKDKVINPSGRRTPGGVPPYRETIIYVSQGVKVYRWLETQGRFGKAPRIESTVRIAPSTTMPTGDSSAKLVLYDPRSGNRFLVDSDRQHNLQLIDQGGPVIISPELRGFPARRGRTSFAGIVKP